MAYLLAPPPTPRLPEGWPWGFGLRRGYVSTPALWDLTTAAGRGGVSRSATQGGNWAFSSTFSGGLRWKGEAEAGAGAGEQVISGIGAPAVCTPTQPSGWYTDRLIDVAVGLLLLWLV